MTNAAEDVKIAFVAARAARQTWSLKTKQLCESPMFEKSSKNLGEDFEGRKVINEPKSSKIKEIIGEFDPGSGRTLAACLTHASRTEIVNEACDFTILVADG